MLLTYFTIGILNIQLLVDTTIMVKQRKRTPTSNGYSWNVIEPDRISPILHWILGIVCPTIQPNGAEILDTRAEVSENLGWKIGLTAQMTIRIHPIPLRLSIKFEGRRRPKHLGQ